MQELQLLQKMRSQNLHHQEDLENQFQYALLCLLEQQTANLSKTHMNIEILVHLNRRLYLFHYLD